MTRTSTEKEVLSQQRSLLNAMKPLPVLSIALVATFLISGLAVLNSGDPTEASVLTRFTSDAEMRYFINTHGEEQGGNNIMTDGRGMAMTEGSSYSKTNVQVEGVDESDLVKTDGTTLFLAELNQVHLIATNPSLSKLSDIVIGGSNISIQGLYIIEGRLVVIYSVYEGIGASSGGSTLNPNAISEDIYSNPYYIASRTCIRVFDVTDPADPFPVLSSGISGALTSSRMVGNIVYLITQQSAWSGEEIIAPQVSTEEGMESVKATSISYDRSCRSVSNFVNLLAFDVGDGTRGNLSALAGSSSICYMSPTSLYLTMPRWEGGMSGIVTTTPGKLSTTIYRISVDGTKMNLAAQGSVEGAPLNQFALDEHDGRLRVATTTWDVQSVNQVHVLDLQLKEVGSLKDIASGERIYSSRFVADRLFLVTFRDFDPLFIISLENDDPVVLGQLKVPGASTYLQMVEGGLLGIGFENGSVKISMYNVTDPSRMSEIESYVVEGCSHSEAQYDHRAVLYDAERQLLTIPVTFYSSSIWGEESWSFQRPLSVALVLKVGGEGVDQAGAILHQNATVTRSLYIEDTLYTISDTTIRANQLPSLSSLGSLVYSEGWNYYGLVDRTMPLATVE